MDDNEVDRLNKLWSTFRRSAPEDAASNTDLPDIQTLSGTTKFDFATAERLNKQWEEYHARQREQELSVSDEQQAVEILGAASQQEIILQKATLAVESEVEHPQSTTEHSIADMEERLAVLEAQISQRSANSARELEVQQLKEEVADLKIRLTELVGKLDSQVEPEANLDDIVGGFVVAPEARPSGVNGEY